MTYIQPTSTLAVPNGLTLTQFLQTVLVGISGLPGPLVRPKWQIEPPKQPDLAVDWLAFGINATLPDANLWIDTDSDGTTNTQRHEVIEIGVSIYGPEADETYGLLRDGFQIPQNLEALGQANMGFVEIGPGRKIPDLVHERFINRVEASIFLRREIQRVYPIVSLLSASGTIHTVLGNETYLLDWETQTEDT